MAAMGVNTGLIFKSDGSNNPNAPRNSQTPMNRTVVIEKSFTQGSMGDSSSIDFVDFMSPAMMNMPASAICATQSAMFSARDDFAIVVIV